VARGEVLLHAGGCTCCRYWPLWGPQHSCSASRSLREWPEPACPLTGDAACPSNRQRMPSSCLLIFVQGVLTDPASMSNTTLQRYWMGYNRPEGFSNWTAVTGAAAPLIPGSNPFAHWWAPPPPPPPLFVMEAKAPRPSPPSPPLGGVGGRAGWPAVQEPAPWQQRAKARDLPHCAVLSPPGGLWPCALPGCTLDGLAALMQCAGGRCKPHAQLGPRLPSCCGPSRRAYEYYAKASPGNTSLNCVYAGAKRGLTPYDYYLGTSRITSLTTQANYHTSNSMVRSQTPALIMPQRMRPVARCAGRSQLAGLLCAALHVALELQHCMLGKPSSWLETWTEYAWPALPCPARCGCRCSPGTQRTALTTSWRCARRRKAPFPATRRPAPRRPRPPRPRPPHPRCRPLVRMRLLPNAASIVLLL
jgi:hypothetical protein